MSMHRTNLLTNEQKEQKRLVRKARMKKAQWKSENNIRFYKEVEDEITDLHRYGPVYFYFPEFKEPFETIKTQSDFQLLFERQRLLADVNIDLKIISQHQKRTRRDGSGDYRITNIKIFCKQCGPKLIMRYSSGQRTME
jgi:hypothetical protein